IYQLIIDFLNSLEGEVDVNQLVHAFQIKTLLFSGFKPHLDTCLTCKKLVSGQARFSLKDGGLICLQCPSKEEIHLISPGTVASIQFIEKNDWPNCMKLRMTDAVKTELKYVL